MSNNVIPFSTDALASIEQFATDAGGADVMYLKFTRTGDFVYGVEENVVEDDEQFAVNMASLQRGYICWMEGQVAGEEMRHVTSGQSVRLHDLPEIQGSDGWREQVSVEMTNLETGDRLLFKSSSKGGLGAIAHLAREFADNAKRGADKIVPVVTCETSSYKHSSYGKIFVPKFPVVDWLAPADVDAQIAGEDPPFEEVEPEPKPTRRGRARKTGGLDV